MEILVTYSSAIISQIKIFLFQFARLRDERLRNNQIVFTMFCSRWSVFFTLKYRDAIYFLTKPHLHLKFITDNFYLYLFSYLLCINLKSFGLKFATQKKHPLIFLTFR